MPTAFVFEMIKVFFLSGDLRNALSNEPVVAKHVENAVHFGDNGWAAGRRVQIGECWLLWSDDLETVDFQHITRVNAHIGGKADTVSSRSLIQLVSIKDAVSRQILDGQVSACCHILDSQVCAAVNDERVSNAECCSMKVLFVAHRVGGLYNCAEIFFHAFSFFAIYSSSCCNKRITSSSSTWSRNRLRKRVLQSMLKM